MHNLSELPLYMFHFTVKNETKKSENLGLKWKYCNFVS